MKKIFISIGLAICLCITAFFIYVNDYYHAEEDAIAVMSLSDSIAIEENENDIAFVPKNAEAGFIFYPGGKVAAESYAPLMKECANQGILCILVKMPFNLAVFNINGAKGIQERYDIEKWYIGGHSLGGSMAASYVSNHVDEYDGLVLLASYSTEDLSDTDLEVLSIYGSEDQVLSMDKYEENKINLSSNYKEYVIEGGNHAYFGNYGEQDGDGVASITHDEQISITVNYIYENIVNE